MTSCHEVPKSLDKKSCHNESASNIHHRGFFDSSHLFETLFLGVLFASFRHGGRQQPARLNGVKAQLTNLLLSRRTVGSSHIFGHPMFTSVTHEEDFAGIRTADMHGTHCGRSSSGFPVFPNHPHQQLLLLLLLEIQLSNSQFGGLVRPPFTSIRTTIEVALFRQDKHSLSCHITVTTPTQFEFKAADRLYRARTLAVIFCTYL